ncbi:NAD-dependent epimerase/dehydratase family protein [Rhodovulum kholense]|uniref:UDP-glucuronate decarboxylase n=1 Tax=Rhodovulum kholense TaxID=453584 RepID=A0A8E3AR16_9RHOB|nr:NAD(P)-dependent oxidoreductase [Rhodovulum kholense]PTW50378.1 UDP-glucuronate decarboxylase [Rhodovulum kholense]
MIRWIVPGRLATGPAREAHLEGATRIDLRHLVDAAGNATDAVARHVADGVAALERGETLLLVCDFGVSRSNAVAAGVLARWQGLPFDAAVARVIEATGEREIKLDMLDTVRAALGAARRRQGGRTLVTGATGFIGRHLCTAFPNRVTGGGGRETLDLMAAPAQIAARLGEARAGRVIHLAHPRIYTNNAALGEALTMQKNLMDAAASLGVRLVLVSCAAVFAGGTTTGPVPSSAPPCPRGVAGQIKALQEGLLKLTVEASGLEACVVRLAQTYGPGGLRPRLIQSFAEGIAAGRPVTTHRFEDGPAKLELLHVDDAVRGLVEIAEAGTAPVYHLGSDDIATPAEIAGMIATRLDQRLDLAELPVAGRADRVRLDWSATRDDLGWRPRIALADGLAETLAALGAPGHSRD